MKKNDVKIGDVYNCKISGNVVPVRIDSENPRGGWDGTNLTTKKSVRIRSAQRLRDKATHDVDPQREQASAERAAQQVRKDIAKTVQAVEKGDLAKGVNVPTSKKKRGGGITEANKADAVNAAMPAVDADKKKRMSGLDAAAKVLADANEPLSTKVMVERMLAKGLWTTNGKTPSNTLYASILREITTKGDASRFVKTERGKFALAPKR